MAPGWKLSARGRGRRSGGVQGGEAVVDLGGGGAAESQGGDVVAVDGEQGGETPDAEYGGPVEVGVCRGLRLGALEGGDDGVGVQSGVLGDLPVGGGVGQAQAVDVEDIL